MNVRFARRHVSTLVTLGAVLALSVACSSSKDSTTDTSTDKTEPTPTTPSKDAGTTKPSQPEPEEEPKTGDELCASKSGAQACQTCCAQGHQKGYQTYQGALLACACGTGGGDAGAGECATECKDTICKSTPSNPDNACSACLNSVLADQNAPCVEPLTTACQADKDCVALLNCAQGCPQN